MTKKKIVWQTAFLAFLIIATVLIIMQHRSMPYQHDEGMVFGTVYNITYQYDSDIKQDIEAELQKVDNSLSPFNKTSIISKVNRNENPKVDEMFTEVFNLAAKVSSETGGAFDITVAPLVNMWGFGTKQFHRPDKESVDSLMRFVGFHKVSLRDGHVVKSDPRIQLDCSAIAKGYGCDVVARYLRSKGIKNFMIEIGGEVVTSGQNEKNLRGRLG